MINTYTSQLYNLPITMITTQVMLTDFKGWVFRHTEAISLYIEQYPYVQYLTINTITSLRNKITDIIDHIVIIITTPNHTNHHKYPCRRDGNYSSQEVNVLCKIKGILDQIRIKFLTVQTIKSLNIQYIINKVDETIGLTAIPVQNKLKDRQPNPTRNRSFDQIRYKQTPTKGLIDRYEEELNRKTDQKERAMKMKNRLYDQMMRDLRKKDEEKGQNRQRRVISDYRSILTNEMKSKHEWKRQKFEGESVQNKYQLQKPRNSHQKRIFKYLEEDPQQQRGDKKDEQNEFLFETPKKNKFRTLPSTQHLSTNRIKEDFSTEVQKEPSRPMFRYNEIQLQVLPEQLNIDLLISKIERVKSEPSEEDQRHWEQFDKDSIQIDKDIGDNLEDSLQLMKEEEALNKTGSFNHASFSIGAETHQYSFSND